MKAIRSKPESRTFGTMSLHIDLGSDSLDQFIDRLSASAYQAYPDVPRSREAYRAVRDAVEEQLRQVIVEYDVCGLSKACVEAQPHDPWGGAADE